MGGIRVTTKLIESVISEIAGDDVIPVVLNLKDKKNVSEFVLAQKTKKDINEIRNMLYRLYNENLVSFTKKKDKKKGWYIYYWTFNKNRIKYLTSAIKKKRLGNLTDRLEREQSNNFFVCQNECIRLDFEQATEFEFKCPECGSLLEHEDNKERIKSIKERISQIKSELKKCVI